VLVLGSVELREESDAPAVGDMHARLQPKRMALLAYVAVAAGPVRRDILRGLFWPELDDTQARRALNQAVFHLRRALGDDAFASEGTETFEVRRDRLRCDAVEFEELCAAGNLERAMALYRGPFADGFHVSDLAAVERWIDATRARLSGRAVAACVALSVAAETANPRGALGWARRAYEIDPTEGAVRRIMSLHDALGDRAAAIRQYEQFARELRTELELEPSDETRRMAEGIRARDTAGDPIPRAKGAAQMPTFTPTFTPVTTPSSTPSSPVLAQPAAPMSARRPVRSRSRAWLGAIGVGVAVALVAAWRIVGRPDATPGPSNPAARTAYVAGERDLAAGRFEAAVQNFRQAVNTDSSYAMAQYRLSVAANWTGESGMANTAASHALELARTLPPHERSRIEAWGHYLRGETDQAEQLYTGMLAADRNDYDASFYLAEIQYHWGPSFGQPVQRSAAAWDRVLALDPNNAGALIHRVRLASMAFDSAQFERFAARLASLNPSVDYQIEVRALRAFSFGDTTDRAAARAEIASVDALRRALVHQSLVSSRNLADAGRRLVPTLVAGRGFSSWEQGEFLLGAQVEAATGQLSAALATIDSAALIQPDRALEYKGMLATIPGMPFSDAWRASVRTALETPLDRTSTYPSAPALRRYLAVTLAVRAGDAAEAKRNAEALKRLAVPGPIALDSGLVKHVARLSRIADAEIARAEGRREDALRILGKTTVEPDLRVPYVWSYPRAHERFLRGQLLAETGKLKEAREWFATFPDPNAYDLAYLPAALLWQSALSRWMGDRAGAEAARQRAEELWPGVSRLIKVPAKL
jgi:DNA-binding SARP family transcriptional activator/Tfp pilus assembly protein PilF